MSNEKRKEVGNRYIVQYYRYRDSSVLIRYIYNNSSFSKVTTMNVLNLSSIINYCI